MFSTWFIYRWKQILASVAVLSALVNTGNVVGWSIEASRIIADPEISFNVTSSSLGLLVSVGSISSIPATLLTGFWMECIGPARLLFFILIPSALAWIVMAMTDSFALLITGRVITGGVAFMLTTIAQPLVAEICQADVRGALSTFPELAISFGMLIVYIFARFLPWQVGTLLSGLMVFPALAAMMFVPESPYWHLKKNNVKEARRSLMRLRAPEHDVDAEITSIADSMRNQSFAICDQLKALKDSANHRPLLLICVLFFLRELGGSAVIFMYAAFFFENAGVMMDPFTCSVLVGVSRLLFTFLSVLFIDRLGRRPLFIGSSIVCFVTMLITGMALRLDMESLMWIPLVAVLIYVAAFGFGSGPVPWILIGEMLPTPIRSVGASIATCVFTTVLFGITQAFPSFIAYAGLDDAVFTFGFFHLIAAIVAWLFLPETRNKTLEELQTAFSGAALRPFRENREGYLQTYGTTFSNSEKVY